jgi:hypothetical protein
MKTFAALLISCILLTSCATQRFYVGDTQGETVSKSKAKSLWLIGGLVPINNKHTVPATAGATGYIITTRYNVVDVIISSLTAGIVITKNIKYEAVQKK